MGRFKQLNLEEREKIYVMREQGKRVVEITREIGRRHSSVSREIKRNKIHRGKYIACKAQEKAEQRSREQRTCPVPDILNKTKEYITR